MNIINEFKNIAYEYFPVNNNLVYSEEYYKTKQIQKLASISEKHKMNNLLWKCFVDRMLHVSERHEIRDVSFNYEGWLSRSYGLVIYLKETEKNQSIIDINISYLIPYYTVSYLIFEKENDTWKDVPTVSYESDDVEINELLILSKEKIKEVFNFKEFPSNLLSYKLTDLSFESIKTDFTFLNAFFLNHYRMRF